MKRIAAALTLSALICAGTTAHALTFDFTFGSSISQETKNGFIEAGNIWSSLFTDAVTIKIDADFEAMSASNILGYSSSTTVYPTYEQVKLALSLDQSSADDTSAVASLQNGSTLSFYNTNDDDVSVLDNNGSTNNIFLEVSTANAKALGFNLDGWTGYDCTIRFNSNFSFDYDVETDFTAGSYDFVGIALHEIGHTLGFTSGVDIYDWVYNDSAYTYTDIQESPIATVLDLYRYSVQGLDLSIGGSPYFSIDGGVTNLGLLSTGSYDGDGYQASHWKDMQGLGIMDPTFASQEIGTITELDLRAFDVIGWDRATAPVPEPGTLLLFGIGLAGLLGYRQVRDPKKD